jgi:DNA-binding transcriptional ArsR family regulator
MLATDELSRTFSALADPTRRSILARLAEGEATVNELAGPFAMSQQAISQHIQVLERAGLVTRTRRAQYRPCRLAPEPLDAAVHWIARHRQMWEERYDRLDDHIAAIRDAAETEEKPT